MECMNPNSSRPDQPEQFDNDSLTGATRSTTPGSEPAPIGYPGTDADASHPTRDLERSPAPAPAPAETQAETDTAAGEHPKKERPAKVKGSVAAGTWAALILGALLLILLLVFILQNQDQVDINLFAWSFQLPAGIAYLFSAIVGAMIMALVGGWRMFELRRQVRKANR